jgi:hypothetical protein
VSHTLLVGVGGHGEYSLVMRDHGKTEQKLCQSTYRSSKDRNAARLALNGLTSSYAHCVAEK